MDTNFWLGRKVLLTGATGVLGSEVVNQLIQKGADLVVIVRDRVRKSRFYLEGFCEKVDVTYGDIGDFDFVERVMGEYEVEVIFHLAAQTQVKVGNASPISTFNSNIKGTWNVLEAARWHQAVIRSIVVASSDKAYGDQETLPYSEETPLQGRHPYDVSKSCTDLLAQSYWHSYQLPLSITRCGNLFGPGDLNLNRLIPGTIVSLLNHKAPVIRSDGKYIRNYFYIKDAARGYLAIAENINKTRGQAYNLGPEDRYSVLEIVEIISRLMDSTLKPVIESEARNEIREQYLDVQKIKRELGWQTQFTLEEALKETIEWYKRYGAI